MKLNFQILPKINRLILLSSRARALQSENQTLPSLIAEQYLNRSVFAKIIVCQRDYYQHNENDGDGNLRTVQIGNRDVWWMNFNNELKLLRAGNLFIVLHEINISNHRN